MAETHDLSVIIHSHVPLVMIPSQDENSVTSLLQRVAREHEKTLYKWSVTDGLKTAGFGLELQQEAEYSDPETLLNHLKSSAPAGFYMLCDLHPWLVDNPKVVRLLKDIALRNSHGAITVFLVSHALALPPELTPFSAEVKMTLPSPGEILVIVKEEARLWAQRHNGQKVKADAKALNLLANSLQGLSHTEVRRLARSAIVDDGAITESDIPDVNLAKFRLLEMEGVLTYEYDTEQFAEVGGMENLKSWLDVRRTHFMTPEQEDSPDRPKGVLLLGFQGAGKSLAAKAIAGLWSVPLLRLDMGALYNKYHGETERNLRESLAMADRMSPCVMWVDEIEKGLGQSDSDGGVSRRVLGTLLTWMSERQSQVFLVATANDISRLPPELVRKGRFDELFFVGLPDAEAREIIFSIHLRKRGYDPAAFDLSQLAEAADGYSGAEIEQAVVAMRYAANAREMTADTQLLESQLLQTTPLSIVMSEQLEALRNWAYQRNVPLA